MLPEVGLRMVDPRKISMSAMFISTGLQHYDARVGKELARLSK